MQLLKFEYLNNMILKFEYIKFLHYHDNSFNTTVLYHIIDNTHPYGYETNHVSPLISMQSRWFYPSFALQKTFPGLWFYAMMNAY